MNKALWTVNVDNYSPKVTALSYPLLKRYAEKCNAEFRIITERKYPGWPPVYEKLQIHELGRDYDWNIYIDSDVIVQPEMFDVTNNLSKDTVCHNANDFAGNRWKYDHYFRRDGRNIGSCNWLAIASDWCLDLWKPLDIPLEEALKNIYPTVHELATHVWRCQNIQCQYEVPTTADSTDEKCTRCVLPDGSKGQRKKFKKAVITAQHLIDDYTLSRNIARFGLKFTTVRAIQERIGANGMFLWHVYTSTVEEKLKMMHEVLTAWGLD